jgi:hypothetical protein
MEMELRVFNWDLTPIFFPGSAISYTKAIASR